MISCVPSLVSELHLPFARISGVRSLAFRGVGHALSFDMLEEALEDIGFKHLDNCRNHFHYCKSGQTLASTKNTIIVISNQRKIHINTIPYDIRSFVRSVVRSFVHSFVRSFVHSCIHSFIHSFTSSRVSSFACVGHQWTNNRMLLEHQWPRSAVPSKDLCKTGCQLTKGIDSLRRQWCLPAGANIILSHKPKQVFASLCISAFWRIRHVGSPSSHSV